MNADLHRLGSTAVYLLCLKIPEGLVQLLDLVHLLAQLLVVGPDDDGQLSHGGRLGLLVT